MALRPDIHEMWSLSQEMYGPGRWKPLLKHSRMMDALLFYEYFFLHTKQTGSISPDFQSNTRVQVNKRWMERFQVWSLVEL